MANSSRSVRRIVLTVGAVMEKTGISVSELAKRTGLNRGTVSKYKRGRVKWVEIMARLAAGLGV